MKMRFLPAFTVASVLLLSGCNTEKRDDATAGEAVSDMNQAADEGGVKADAVVIDNQAGPTVTADADSAGAATDSTAATPRP
ncbi:hypothetical protein [Hymenobacter weizhouensis]|uniref:hypothetical protein n=1 Tax=Hymenobacter sp. YIM 151500-1 TaxID=2987689 RepID=UPI00222744D9|nr:hypothetical protein [Hymenobacter sp. YIM 151500-1]UYZ62057.1 hypothetical protein OIS53_13710 [Hymenobacter sp. YIM 151500-1]